MPQETGNYSVAGFRMVMERKVSQYVITYYLPSGLFVVVSWASFLIPSDDIQVTKTEGFSLMHFTSFYKEADTDLKGENQNIPLF